MEQLTGPEPPEALAYLWHDRFLVIDNLRGEGFSGPGPFTASLITDTAKLYGWELDPLEVSALSTLDVIVRNPDAGAETESDAVQDEQRVNPAERWPTKKVADG